MKTLSVFLSILLIFSVAAPARADFSYTEKSAVTGGALVKLVKFTSIFNKKAAQDALQPTVTSRYVRKNQLRIDDSDGKIQIIDLEARQVMEIDTKTKTYGVATFDQIKAAMEQAQQQMQQAMAQQAQTQPRPAQGNQPPPQVTITPKVEVLPGTGSRTILGQNTTETKIRFDMEMTATQNQGGGQASGATPTPVSDTASGQNPQTGTLTTTMVMDSFVAPSLSGYQEFAEFYQRLAKEVNWTPPSGINIDPRAKQGLAEMQKNSASLKGLPLLSYVSMAFAGSGGGQQNGAQQTANGQNGGTQQSGNSTQTDKTSSSSSGDVIPTTTSEAVMKGLGGLFAKKKQKQQQQQQQDNSANSNSSSSASAPPPGVNGPNDFMDMTTEVTSFSTSALPDSMFQPPAGYTQVQPTMDQVLGKAGPKQ